MNSGGDVTHPTFFRDEYTDALLLSLFPLQLCPGHSLLRELPGLDCSIDTLPEQPELKKIHPSRTTWEK
jgi:hypothetical protein